MDLKSRLYIFKPVVYRGNCTLEELAFKGRPGIKQAQVRIVYKRRYLQTVATSSGVLDSLWKILSHMLAPFCPPQYSKGQ